MKPNVACPDAPALVNRGRAGRSGLFTVNEPGTGDRVESLMRAWATRWADGAGANARCWMLSPQHCWREARAARGNCAVIACDIGLCSALAMPILSIISFQAEPPPTLP